MKDSIVFIFKFIFKEKPRFFFGIFMTALVSTLTWTGPKVIAFIIDQGLLKSNQEKEFYGVLALAATEVFRLLFVFLSQINYAVLGQNVIERVRKDLVHHLLKLPISYFDQVTSGGMMTRVVNDVNSLTDFFQSGFVSVLGNMASLIAIFIGLFSINFRLGLILFLTFVPVVFLCSIFSERLRRVYEETRNRLSELNSKLADLLFGMKTVRALGLGEPKFKELNLQVRHYADSQMNMVKTFALFHPTLSFGIGSLLMLLVWIGIPMVSSGQLPVGQWVAALSYVVLLQQPLMEISDRWNFFLAGLTSINRIREVLREKEEKSGDEKAPPFESIVWNQVSFRYHSEAKKTLKQVNINLKRGDWIGIFGESGSGKSTFLQMLYGFYPPTEGDLLWNGRPYSDFNAKSMRSYFGVVEQFPFLFTGTIKENITLYGHFKWDEETLHDTFKDFPLIMSLLQNPDFDITERGGNLSMGQKQMITFLRAYLAKPMIWILDEATAFFDPEAEQEVLRALEALRKDQITVIQVAHRPEALVQMKRHLKVELGHLQEHYSNQPSKPTDLT